MRGSAAIFHEGFYYYFGGYSTVEVDSILRLSGSSWTWSHLGQLNSRRDGHGVILVGTTFMVVGGYRSQKNEACLLRTGQFICTKLTSTSLYEYRFWPIMYLVDEDYGNC